jgi:hypothetical protein
VFKHALASNGFFNQARVTERMLLNGDLDYLFNVLTDREVSSLCPRLFLMYSIH